MRQRSKRWIRRGSDTAVPTLMAFTVVGCCLAAAAYAAIRTAAGEAPHATRPLQPHITAHPDPKASATAGFDWAQPPRPATKANPGHSLGFQCRLDDDGWAACQAPFELRRLSPGRHRFRVRATNEAGRSGPAAVWSWLVRRERRGPAKPAPAPDPAPPSPPEPSGEEGAPFSIEQTSPPGNLFPGAPAQPLALRLTNPGATPIAVTAIEASLAAQLPGCTAENFLLIPSDASPAHPLSIPAEAGVDLPAQGISPPAIAMLDLQVSQDACQGVELQLRYSGRAEG